MFELINEGTKFRKKVIKWSNFFKKHLISIITVMIPLLTFIGFIILQYPEQNDFGLINYSVQYYIYVALAIIFLYLIINLLLMLLDKISNSVLKKCKNKSIIKSTIVVCIILFFISFLYVIVTSFELLSVLSPFLFSLIMVIILISYIFKEVNKLSKPLDADLTPAFYTITISALLLLYLFITPFHEVKKELLYRDISYNQLEYHLVFKDDYTLYCYDEYDDPIILYLNPGDTIKFIE